MDSPVERYLEELRRELRANPLLARRVLEEVADHLAEAVAAEKRAGADALEAEARAVRRLGEARSLARAFDPFDLPMRVVLLVAASSTVLMALWLSWVVLFVLPARDPAHVGFWRVVAAAFVAYGALTFAFLARGPRSAWLRGTVRLVSVAAVTAGLWGIATMLRVARTGGHFEGYIVLMGALLAGHGLAALAYDLVAVRIAQRARRA